MGTSKLSYDVVPGWGRLPNGWSFVEVSGVDVDSQDRVYVFNRGAHPVIVFDREGSFVASWGERLFTRPHGIRIGPDDSVYCTDVGDHTVRKFTSDGKLLMTLGTENRPSDTGCQGRDYRTIRRAAPPFNAPTNVALSLSGEIYVSDGYGNARVHRFAPDGKLLLSWGEPGAGPGQFNLPHGVAVTKDGRAYVADRQNDRIQVFGPDGEFIFQWKGVYRPDDLCIDGNGHLYVAELGHRVGIVMGMPVPTPSSPWSRVSVFDLDGRPLTFWGEPDGKVPGNFHAAHAICCDSRGALYVGEVIWSVSQGNPPAGCHTLQKFVRAS